MTQLAIVIPCYKGTFLKSTLDSLVAQSNQNFNVYIGDDNSKDDIENIIEGYRNKINISYKKFSTNLGSVSLVQQWERCIFLSKDEPWIWLLPDDDYADENCVEGFYNFQSRFNVNLYRFNTKVVDENENLIEEPCINPLQESGVHFIADKFLGKRRSSIAEYIFSRHIFIKKRIIEFPLAWCSDDATWLSFSENKGIVTIDEGFVNVRISSESISGDTDKYGEPKIEACLQYLIFLKKNYFHELSEEFKKSNTSFNEMTKRWFLIQMADCNIRLTKLELLKMYINKISKIWGPLSVDSLKTFYFILKKYN